MAKHRILVVDDEADIIELLQFNLEKEGYQVLTAMTGEAAVKAAQAKLPELIVLDLMLPGIDGMEVCRILKRDARTSAIPIIMLTAKTEDIDIVAGLELGAVDYVTKPFSPKVLIARIRAVFRRDSVIDGVDESAITIHELTINATRRIVMVGEDRVDLTASEFDILHFLASHPGWVYSRDRIITAVKGDDYPVTERSIDVQIVGLRRKLGSAGDLIETVRGVGYRFKE
ncbi:response regulator transcription factor [bacterium]|nr:response regulator transcription factor [candidate division CSSED10-310 bacterium]